MPRDGPASLGSEKRNIERKRLTPEKTSKLRIDYHDVGGDLPRKRLVSAKDGQKEVTGVLIHYDRVAHKEESCTPWTRDVWTRGECAGRKRRQPNGNRSVAGRRLGLGIESQTQG